MGISKKKILIIVPAYNEEGNIKRTVEELASLGEDYSILVVNDGSKDSTFEKAKQTEAIVASLPYNLGIGGAVQTGFRYARDKGYDIAVQFDGDGQHDASYISKLLEPVISGEADVCIGSRFLPPYSDYRSSFLRRIGINFFAHLISFLTSYKVTDPTSGFRAFNKRMIKIFAHYYPHDFPEPEAISVSSRYGMKLKEIPVKMRKRVSGSSSIRYLYTLYYMIKVTFAILLDKIKNKKGYLL
ncbi:MAG: hypothetical protein A2Y03_08115 [Omnitrophica WOR_2 bacterium GWF2_38_59]|nr:MAG: hypothetical protein A2Y06_00090 [Omnitrophica WOR_2 bacterium GWA2_37_7]OGX26116.1 MAG: hypothetical protein A2Y03_08115 [Omnitrophica WOR_2 bacterium GWF2_38_59]OGX48928.1 MAG: hypothetical protein A2243_06570 [Omnitrophica WOR_2 bacterium RIFOXYA2_FULL_38_17]OGX52757.1 MAG: hypothetical protein A2267_11005 [Omnitrophica WOR_2 bacterium RIFOXYA12_FULL_38_10]OGX55758.1 MAG: hypothetical protein A2447_12375 [Omnitrophica WOR_2 bacterium RIFOXYC2_FULL_38_12]OGX57526.1 MAG: hypothetical 